MADYTYWHKALALTDGKRAVSRDEMKELGLIDEPQPGFYRRRMTRGGPFVPVAIWPSGDDMVATTDGKPVDAGEVWTYCCAHPIPEIWFRERSAGAPWPDEDVAVTESFAAAPAAPGSIEGHNQPEDDLAAIRDQIEAASKNAKDYEKIESDEVAAKAQALRSRLNELSGQADKKREAEKAPHLAAGKAVDDKWRALVQGPKALADGIRKALSAWETEKDRRRRAAEEEARKKAEAEAKKAPKGTAAAPALQAPDPPPVQTTIRGASGRAAAIMEKKIAKVIDQDAAYQSLKTHPDLITFIQTLAQRAVDAGKGDMVKGIEIEIVKDVR